MVWSSLDESE